MYWNDAVDVAIKLGLGWIVTLDVLKLWIQHYATQNHLLNSNIRCIEMAIEIVRACKHMGWIVTLDVLKWINGIMESLCHFALNSNIRCIEMKVRWHF